MPACGLTASRQMTDKAQDGSSSPRGDGAPITPDPSAGGTLGTAGRPARGGSAGLRLAGGALTTSQRPPAASSPAPEQPVTHCSPRLRPLAPGTAQLSSACQPQTHSCLSKPSLSPGRCFPPASPSAGSSHAFQQPPTRDSVHCCQKPHDHALNGGDDTFPSSPTHRSPACALLGPDAHTPGFGLPRAWGRQQESGSQSHGIHARTWSLPLSQCLLHRALQLGAEGRWACLSAASGTASLGCLWGVTAVMRG